MQQKAVKKAFAKAKIDNPLIRELSDDSPLTAEESVELAYALKSMREPQQSDRPTPKAKPIDFSGILDELNVCIVDPHSSERSKELAIRMHDLLVKSVEPYDSYTSYEALVLANMLAEQIHARISCNRAVASNPAWYELANKASTALQDLYQAIGKDSL